ncbi:hypothetical protein KW796_01855 [Candidatus Parcubacteria bacterium]|nr:hypothetical protein [Candidatus Parcubacteria bacterium]
MPDSMKATNWTALEERIRIRVEELCKDRPKPMLVSNVRLAIGPDLVPDECPRTSLNHESHLTYLVSKSFDYTEAWICDENISIEILPEETPNRDAFDLSLTWNVIIPEYLVRDLPQHFADKIRPPSRS